MKSTYTYDPDAWHPALAGLVAGAIGAIVAALVSLPLRSPDEIVANSLSVVVASLVLGVVAGMLWRRIRVSHRAFVLFGLTMAGSFVVSMVAVAIADRLVLANFVPYAAPLAAIIFITLGFLVPLLAGVTAPVWVAAVPVIIAVGLGIGLFGRGNVASGELGLDDLTSTSTTAGVSGSTATTLGGTLSIPDDLAATYTIVEGIATYSVEENLRGLQARGVGTTDAISGSITPGEGFTFTIDLQSFTSDQSIRDGRVRGWFAEFPEGTFVGTDPTLPTQAQIGDPVSFLLTGDLTINTVTLPTTWDVEARIEPDGTLSVAGETFIVLSDFDVPVVTSGMVEMADGATLEVAFSAAP